MGQVPTSEWRVETWPIGAMPLLSMFSSHPAWVASELSATVVASVMSWRTSSGYSGDAFLAVWKSGLGAATQSAGATYATATKATKKTVETAVSEA